MSGDHNQYQKPRSYLDDFECPRCGHCCKTDLARVGEVGVWGVVDLDRGGRGRNEPDVELPGGDGDTGAEQRRVGGCRPGSVGPETSALREIGVSR